MALGVLGIRPMELYAMTPREIMRALQGRAEYDEARMHDRWYRAAWQTAHLLAPWTGKKKITAEKLLGPKFMAKVKGPTPPPPSLETGTAREELESIKRMLATERGSSHA